jgi:hypothetical protein
LWLKYSAGKICGRDFTLIGVKKMNFLCFFLQILEKFEKKSREIMWIRVKNYNFVSTVELLMNLKKMKMLRKLVFKYPIFDFQFKRELLICA